MCHVFPDETRLDILDWLKDGERRMCELTDVFQTGQSRLSFHREVLKTTGLIHDRPEGRWIYYSINSDVVEEIEDLVALLKTMRKTVWLSPRCYFLFE